MIEDILKLIKRSFERKIKNKLMKKIYIKVLMDKGLVLHDLPRYGSLIKYYMALDLVKLDRLLDQKFLNPKMMIETKSVVKKKRS